MNCCFSQNFRNKYSSTKEIKGDSCKPVEITSVGARTNTLNIKVTDTRTAIKAKMLLFLNKSPLLKENRKCQATIPLNNENTLKNNMYRLIRVIYRLVYTLGNGGAHGFPSQKTLPMSILIRIRIASWGNSR